MNKILYYNLESINKRCNKEVLSAIKKRIKSNVFVSTSHPFEREFANYVGAEFAVAVSSGTSALHLSLLALGIKSGDEVITVSHTHRSTVAAIRYCNANPVFVDIDKKTFIIDHTLIEEKITPKTKAILVVHLYGNVAEIEKIAEIAKKHNLFLIEDSSQAHGSKYKNQHVGTFGDIGTFSFYPGKTLGAYADAGCIVTSNKEIEKSIREMQSWGNDFIGFNYRISQLQADVLSIKLKHLNDVLYEKRVIAEKYNEAFGSLCVNKDVQHSYHIYPILVKNRKELIENVKDKVELRCHYELPVHKLSAYRDNSFLPNTEFVSSHQVSLPIYPSVNYKKVIRVIKKYDCYMHIV